jgi:hypothetical protein
MPIFTESEDAEFAALEERDSWFVAVLLAEYGELEGVPPDVEVPAELNWLAQVPLVRRYDFEDAECGLAFVSADGVYRCTVWDVTGEEDDPWAVFVVDEFGARLLPEYSVFDEDADEEEREAILRRASEEAPDRLVRGEFTRAGAPVEIPQWLNVVIEQP